MYFIKKLKKINIFFKKIENRFLNFLFQQIFCFFSNKFFSFYLAHISLDYSKILFYFIFDRDLFYFS
jgi:hypothetical protein